MIAHGERATAEADRLRGLDDERALRQADDARLLERVAAAAADLSAARRTAAAGLGAAVDGVLVELGFPAGVFEVGLGRRPADDDEPAVEVDGDALAFDASGIDQVVFRLAPNAGEPARPLARIASGGELSRVALAIRQVLAEADDTADPRVRRDRHRDRRPERGSDRRAASGSSGRRHQVLCVTHLPQIAAHADAHFRIAKRERDGRTVTEVVRLDGDDRVGELGAMLGGEVGGRRARRRSPRPASCSIAPTRGERAAAISA